MASGNKIPPYGENAAVKQTRGALSDAAVCDMILRYYTIMYPHPMWKTHTFQLWKLSCGLSVGKEPTPLAFLHTWKQPM